MDQMSKRKLVSIIGLLFLLAACAPNPAATQDPILNQQVIDKSVALTIAAQNLQAKDQQLAEQADALTADAKTAQALEQALPTAAPVNGSDSASSTGIPAPLPGGSDSTDSTGVPAPLPGVSDAMTPTPFIDDPIYGPIPLYVPKQQTFMNCVLTITHEEEDPEIFGLPTRVPTLSLDPGHGDNIIVVQPVNLRSGPSFANRILMILRPDPDVSYRVISGPVYIDLGGSSYIVTPKPGVNILRRKYKWWQIESLDHAIRGWVAEASACGEYYFITPAPTATLPAP
jgi:hypothetical protein